jgi:hypothetical protein
LTTAPRFFEDSLDLLREYAERYFALNTKKDDGASEADSLTRAISVLARRTDANSVKQRQELEARLDMPPMPEEFTFAWGSFFDLQATRSSNGFSHNPLSYIEIEAYIRLSGRVLLPYEIRAIKVVDTAFLNTQADLAKAARAAKDASKKSDTTPTPKRVSKRG